MPEELASERGNAADRARGFRGTAGSGASLSGCSAISAQARWLISSVMPWFSDLHARRERRRLRRRKCRAGSCRCRRGAPRRRASRCAATNASHSASSVMLLMTGRARSLGERTRCRRGEAVEHVDRGLRGAGAHAARLGEIGDEESLAAGVGQRRGDRFEAAAIGVGLDHGGAFAGHDRARKRAPVGVDARQDRWSACRRSSGSAGDARLG